MFGKAQLFSLIESVKQRTLIRSWMPDANCKVSYVRADYFELNTILERPYTAYRNTTVSTIHWWILLQNTKHHVTVIASKILLFLMV